MPESFTDALERLDPASRALLDLSLRRGMRPDEIAEVLGAEPGSVEATRDEALRRVAADVGMGASERQLDEVRARLAELPAEQWLGGTARASAPNGNGAAPPVRAARPPVGAGARRRRRWPWLLALVPVAVVVVAIALASGGDDEAPGPAGGGGGTPAAPAEPGQGARLIPVGAGAPDATGTARLTDGGDRLVLEVSGLPERPGRDYVVWLYNSVIDSRNLANVRGTSIDLDVELPGDWRRYRFVDVSVEPRDGRPTIHSGESVMRVPTDELGR